MTAISGEEVFRIEGRFDRPAMLRLRRQMMVAETPRTILDFSRVEKVDDAALPFLTVVLVLLRRKGRYVSLLGLRGHQLRVLHHLGIDVAPGGSVEVNVRDDDEGPF
jgi:ABC-type transporter Mla MlaB component